VFIAITNNTLSNVVCHCLIYVLKCRNISIPLFRHRSQKHEFVHCLISQVTSSRCEYLSAALKRLSATAVNLAKS